MRTSLALNGASGDPAGRVSAEPADPGDRIPDGVEMDGVASADERGDAPGLGMVLGVPELGMCPITGDKALPSIENWDGSPAVGWPDSAK